MSNNRSPVCCNGKPCGNTCIDPTEECHEGQGGATCSSSDNCGCGCSEPEQICFNACSCGNLAAGDCSIGSCGACCDDSSCSRHG